MPAPRGMPMQMAPGYATMPAQQPMYFVPSNGTLPGPAPTTMVRMAPQTMPTGPVAHGAVGNGGIPLVVPQVEPIYRTAPQMNGEAVAGSPAQHIPLAKCRVLYLGSAVPVETAVGLEAVQLPCRERYACVDGKSVEGIDTWLSIFSSGTMMQFVGDQNSITWFPIGELHVCAAVKCVMTQSDSGERTPKFVALDSAAGKQSQHPPMFAAIMRRTKGVKVLECHVFICKSDQAAMAAVQSCTHAYEHKEGWVDGSPPSDTFVQGETHLVAAQNSGRDCAPEFYKKPPPQGYFYSSRKDLVRNYNVAGNAHMFQPMGGDPRQPPAPQKRRPPTRMPPAPTGYFKDWDTFRGRHLGVFAENGGDIYGRTQKHKKKHRHHHHHHPESDSDSSGSGVSEYVYERRPRTPPADYYRDEYQTRPRHPPPPPQHHDDRHRRRDHQPYDQERQYDRQIDRQYDRQIDRHHDRHHDRQYDPYDRNDRNDRYDQDDDFVLYAPRYNRR